MYMARAMTRDFYLTYLKPLWSNSFSFKGRFHSRHGWIVDTIYTSGVVWSDKGGAVTTDIYSSHQYVHIVGTRRSQEQLIILSYSLLFAVIKEIYITT
jgi:hypothetical protein